MLYVYWELTTVFSYLLIGYDPTRRANRRAAITALMVTTFGGLAMLVGIVMLGVAGGTSGSRDSRPRRPRRRAGTSSPRC